MDLNSQQSDEQFETKFLLELIQMCKRQNFNREVEALSRILLKIQDGEIKELIIH